MYSTYAAMHCGGYVCDDQGARVYSNRRDPPECLLPQTRILSACVFCVYNDGIIGKGGIFFIGLKA